MALIVCAILNSAVKSNTENDRAITSQITRKQSCQESRGRDVEREGDGDLDTDCDKGRALGIGAPRVAENIDRNHRKA